GEPHVGDLIQLLQRAQDRQPHFVRRHLRAAARAHLVFNLLGKDGQLVFGNRPSLAGPSHAVDDLVTGERLGGPAPLAHHQDHRFLGGEPAPARGARSPTADRGTVVGCATVHDAAVRVPAVRTEHAITSRTDHGAGSCEHNWWMNHTIVTTTCCVYRRTIPGATPATRQRRIPSVFGNAPSRRRSLLAYRGRLASQALSGGGARPAPSRRPARRAAPGAPPA